VSPLISAIRLAAIGTAVAGALAAVNSVTRGRIEANEQRPMVKALIDVTGDPRVGGLTGSLDPPLTICLATGVPLYRVRHISGRGYGGAIEMLLGIDAADRVTGVRVIGHHETRGIGDVIETDNSAWIIGFNGLPVSIAPALALTRDGGTIDGVTGATITTRAVVSGVRDALVETQNAPATRCTHVLSG